jgi:hypothetical protein
MKIMTLDNREIIACRSIYLWEVGQYSRYSDWIWAGWPRGQSSSHSRETIFLLSTSSRLVLGPTKPPIQWVLGSLFPGDKAVWT